MVQKKLEIELITRSDLIKNHYCLLDSESIYFRFGSVLSSSALDSFINGLKVGQSFGIISEESLVGLAHLIDCETWAELAISVLPAYRNKKLARRLICHCLKLMQGSNIKIVRILVLRNNTPMINLARSLGFEQEKTPGFDDYWVFKP